MRRFILVAMVSVLLLVLSPAAALAEKPDRRCPAESSGFDRVDRDGWWAATVVGFGEAGIPVYEGDGTTFTEEFDAFSAAFGFVDGAGLEAFVRGAQWDIIDKNDNDWVCMRNQPNTPGSPGFIFVGIDDTANAQG